MTTEYIYHLFGPMAARHMYIDGHGIGTGERIDYRASAHDRYAVSAPACLAYTCREA